MLDIDGIVCLRQKDTAFNPQLQFTASRGTMNFPTIERYDQNTSIAFLNSSHTFGIFTCSSNEGHTIETTIVQGIIFCYLVKLSNINYVKTT